MCAPTGAGKTVAFELAIVRLLIAMGQAAFDSKIVYSKLNFINGTDYSVAKRFHAIYAQNNLPTHGN